MKVRSFPPGVLTVGTDIVEVGRIERAAKREPFLNGVYTPAELEYWTRNGKKAETLAGMYCAKEAAAKAFGTGIRGFRPTDIEVTHDASGAPDLRFYNGAALLANGCAVSVSVSHCAQYATAVCLLTRTEGEKVEE